MPVRGKSRSVSRTRPIVAIDGPAGAGRDGVLKCAHSMSGKVNALGTKKSMNEALVS